MIFFLMKKKEEHLHSIYKIACMGGTGLTFEVTA